MSGLLSAKCSVRISFYANSLFRYVITSLPIPSLNILCKYMTESFGPHMVCLWVEERFLLRYASGMLTSIWK